MKSARPMLERWKDFNLSLAGKNKSKKFVEIVQKYRNATRGGSRIFFRRGCTRLLLYFNTNKPHSFFFCGIPVVLENRRSSREGGVRTPCTLPLDPPLATDIHFVGFLLYESSDIVNEALRGGGGKPFHLTWNISGISNRKFCRNGKRPSSYKRETSICHSQQMGMDRFI